MSEEQPIESAKEIAAQAQPKAKKVGLCYFFFKRAFDIVSSFLLILIISWFVLILFIINLFATKGHPIYKDERIGKKAKTVYILKFRSMFFDANDHPEKYLNEEQMEQWKFQRKVDDDPRITKFGKFLRKTSLDELPQLFNILFGTMSVVGPRPISKMELDAQFTKGEQELYLSQRPGLISYWAVNGRSSADFDTGERQKLELEYFQKRGLWFDFCLIFKAIPAVLKHKGAK